VIEDAINAARPDEPAPEPSEIGSADEWLPLRWIDQPVVEPFPIDVFPEPAARLVREGSESIGCPPDYLGLAILAIAGGVIGRSVSLLLKRGYFAASAIWGAIVAPPSRGKTPALKIVATAVRRIGDILASQYAQSIEKWESERVEVKDKSKPPPKPKPQRIDVEDITMESLVIVLSENSRGLVMVRDELSAFVTGMDQYKGGKGNDKSMALKLWSGDAITRDRVLNEGGCPIRCPHPCLSIIGGMTPDMLGSLLDAKGRKDGFIDRFLVCYPDPNPVASWTERGVCDETIDAWSSLVARLWERPLNVKEGKSCPHVAMFTDKGRASWETHYNRHAAEMNETGFPPDLVSVWGKLGEYAGRLALVLVCLWHADDMTLDPNAVPSVDEWIVDAAWRLVAYFKSHARRVHATIARGSGIGGSSTVQAIVAWLRKGERLSFTESEIKQDRRWIDPDELGQALAYMVDRNAIRPVEAPPVNPKGGRPASQAYEVNPALMVTKNPDNPINPQTSEVALLT